jgi:AGZA family xanthine/uracil permease-like MFS transporter
MTRANLKTEAIAGITTFFTMAYIVIVNPQILATPGTGMPLNGVVTATVHVCFFMTLLMGLYADLPYAVAPGMGINAFFAFTVVLGHKVPWQTALGIVFWAGVLFVLLSVTAAREIIAKAIPPGLRSAAAAGIGVFITFIGLQHAGLIVKDPVTLVHLGHLDERALMSLGGVVFILFMMRHAPSIAFLSGILLVTAVAALRGKVHQPPHLFQEPDFWSVFLKADIMGALKLSLLPTMFAVCFTDLFDSISTFVGVSRAAGLVDEDNQPKNLRQGLIVDAIATMGAGLVGSSSGTAYIESIAGIEAGGRTGWTAVFTALCFLPCYFLAPVVQMVPDYATAPVLIIVGALMFRTVSELPTKHLEDVVPQYLTVVLIPLTYSISQGLLWGFVFHVVMYTMAGRAREIHKTMWLIALLSVGLLGLDNLFP